MAGLVRPFLFFCCRSRASALARGPGPIRRSLSIVRGAWVPACARTTPNVLRVRAIPDSFVKQPAFALLRRASPRSQRSATPILGGAGHAVVPLAPSTTCRGDGAPQGASNDPRPARRGHPWRRVRAARRSIAAISVPGAVLPDAATSGICANPTRTAFAVPRPRHVQPLKAGLRSEAGRLPGASRVREERSSPARGRRIRSRCHDAS